MKGHGLQPLYIHYEHQGIHDTEQKYLGWDGTDMHGVLLIVTFYFSK